MARDARTQSTTTVQSTTNTTSTGGRGSVDIDSTSCCASCHTEFSLFHRAHICKSCRVAVCSRCSTGFGPGRRCLRCSDKSPKKNGSADALSPGGVVIAEPEQKPVQERWAEPPLPAWVTHMPQSCRQAWLEGYGVLHVRLLEGRGLMAADLSLGIVGSANSSDPYCVVSIDGQDRHTRMIKRTLHPRWDSCFEFRVRDPFAKLHVNVFDHDSAPGNSDDFLGCLEVSILDLVPNKCYSGWHALSDNEARELEGVKELGGVLLEVMLEVTSVTSERWLSITGVPPTAEPPPPPFDLDKVYAPLMLIIDLVWTRFLSPCIFGVLDTIQWTNPKTSAFWFLLCLGLAIRPQYIPFAFWALLAVWHWSKKPKLKPRTSSPIVVAANVALAAGRFKKGGTKALQPESSPEETQSANGEVEEAHLGGFVKTVAMIAPSWIKDMCRGYQPLLQMVAELLQMLHGAFVWAPKSTTALPFQCGLWAFAVLHLICPLHYVLIIEVVVAFTVLTPAFTMTLGSVNYMLKGSPKGIPALQDEYDQEWHSCHARKKEMKKTKSLTKDLKKS